MKQFLTQSKKTSSIIANLSGEIKNKVLHEMADALIGHSDYIITRNATDMENGKTNNLSAALMG